MFMIISKEIRNAMGLKDREESYKPRINGKKEGKNVKESGNGNEENFILVWAI